jgi:hypothetical protein
MAYFNVVEGRSLNVGEKVEVYYNIQKGGFSIVSRDKRNPNNGKVVAHSSFVHVENASFHINKKKLDNILAINRKTVYAVVKGTFLGSTEIQAGAYRKGYCNPFKTGCFVDYETGIELTTAKNVYFYDKYFSFK